jgi:hypothetical protein
VSDSFAAKFNRARILADSGRSGEALAIFDSLVAERPDHRESRFNRAIVLADLHRHAEAVLDYGWLLANGCGALEPAVRFSRGISNLVLGNLRAGFAGFESRGFEPVPPHVGWDGKSSLEGKVVLVLGDMVYGDNVAFARYLPLLQQRGAKVLIGVPPALAPLMATIAGVTTVSLPDEVPACDAVVRLLSLAHAFRTEAATIPPPPTFDLPADQRSRWSAGMGSGPSARVGLCWCSGRKTRNGRFRDVPLAMLEPLLGVPGVEVYSLQAEVPPDDREAFARFDFWDVGSKLANFLDTACAASCMDAVVTVDTSVAHVAASLGVPTLVMLPSFRPYWMWLASPNPWYPSARSFRQNSLGDWRPVVDRVVEDVADVARSQRMLKRRSIM